MNTARIFATVCLSVFLAASCACAATQELRPNVADDKPFTLDDCYAMALKQSERIAILQQKIEEVAGQYLQAVSTVTPKGNFLLTEFHQDSPQSNSEGAGSVGSTFNLDSRPERKFVLSQPLFRGFRSLAAIGGAQSLKSQRTDEVRRAKELLFMDVVEAFYGVLGPRDEVESLQNIRELSEQRIGELDERVRLGKSRPSEIANATAQLKQVQAQIEQTRRAEVIWVNVLRFLTGKNDIPGLVDTPEAPAGLQDLDFYLLKAKDRSDVRAAKAAVEVAKQGVVIARADIFPQLSIDSNLYTKRVGFQSNTDWDVMLTFNVPILEFVKVTGAVKEAQAKQREAELELSRVLRSAEADIRNAFEELKLSLAATRAFKEAETASVKNFEIQTKEYRLNLVNNLDVLTALQELLAVRRSLVTSRYQAKSDQGHLKVATGDLLL